MHDGDAADAGTGRADVGVVDAVGDVAVLDVVHQLAGGHGGAVVFRFGRARTQVGHADAVFGADELIGGEVGDVALQLAAFQGFQHGVGVHQLAARVVDEHAPVLHLGDVFGVEHALGRGGQGDVYGHKVRLLQQGGQVRHVHAVIQVQRAADGEVRVVADDVHAQLHGGVCHHHADGAQADDAQRLAQHFMADEGRLALFHRFGNAFGALERLDPFDGVHDLAPAEEELADDQLFDGVGVGARGVEDDDALLRAGGDGDVVGARARTRHREELFSQRVFVHVEAAQHDAVGVFYLFGKDVAFGEFFICDFADLVQLEYFRHCMFLLARIAVC